MRYRLFILLALCCLNTLAQEKPVEVQLKAGLVSDYIWRGMRLGDVSIQPSLSVDWQGLSLTADGSTGFDRGSRKEIDLTLGYATGGLSLYVTDYWDNTSDERYLLYNAHSTSHQFEASVAYDFGHFSLSWSTMFAGADGVNKSGKRAYSSYVELNVPFRLAKLDWNAQVAVTPYATSYYDTNGFSIVNTALSAQRSFTIGGMVEMPVSATFIANPRTQAAYFVLGIGFVLGSDKF